MNITLKINGIDHNIDTAPSTTLFAALRGLGFHGVKFGDEGGLVRLGYCFAGWQTCQRGVDARGAGGRSQHRHHRSARRTSRTRLEEDRWFASAAKGFR